MRTVRLALASLSLLAVGCAGHSGYNIDVRNDTNQPVALALMAEQKNQPPKVIDNWHIAAAASSTHFTQVEAKTKVTLEAQVEGETARPPAAMPVTLGQTKIDIVPQRDNAVNDPKASRIRLREREGH
jgi:hypothetical protein